MRRKLLTLILTACMVLSMFSGLPLPALAETDGLDSGSELNSEHGVISEIGNNSEIDTLSSGDDISASDSYELSGDTSAVHSDSDGTAVYSTDEDSSEISLLSFDDTLNYAYDNGILRYSTINDWSADLTRAQMAELLAGTLLKTPIETQDLSEAPAFYDVSPDNLSENTYKAILWCAKIGLLNGENTTTFNPQGIVTRAQAAKLLYRITGRNDGGYTGGAVLDGINKSDWFYSDVMNLYELGIIPQVSGSAFDPNMNITNSEILQWFVNLMHSYTEPTVFSYEELTDALSNPEVQSVNVTRDITVPEGTVLNINKDVSIYGRRSLSLQVNSKIIIKNTAVLTLSGSHKDGSEISSGQLVIESGGTLVTDQNLYIGPAVSFEINEGARVIVNAGKTLTIDCSALINGTIQLNSGSGEVPGALLVVTDKIYSNGTGTISGDGGAVKPGCVRARQNYDYYYDTANGYVLEKRDSVNVSVDSSLEQAPINAVLVTDTATFNLAMNSTDPFFEILYISQTDSQITVASLEDIETFKHIVVENNIMLLFDGNDADSAAYNKVVIPSNILITLNNDSSSIDAMSIAEGTEVEVHSDWSQIGRTDLYGGIEFKYKDIISDTFGGIVCGWKDDTDNQKNDPTYRECYFGRSGDTLSAMIEDAALSMSRADMLIYGGGINAELTPLENRPSSLTVGDLYILGNANLTIDSGFTLSAAKGNSEGWRRQQDDGKYGRDFYYIHSADPGYVYAESGSSLTVNGELRCEANLDWTEIIVINPAEAQDYKVGENNVVSISPNAYYAGLMGVPADSLLVVFSNGNNPQTWTGTIDLNGGSMSVGAGGAVRAHHIWLGINPWNAARPDLGYSEAEGSNVRLDGGIARSVIETATIYAPAAVSGDLTIEPDVILTVSPTETGETLHIDGVLRVYGGLTVGTGAAVEAERSIHKMYYFNKSANPYVYGTLSDSITDYWVGLDNEAALDTLLKTEDSPSKISLLFGWYLGGWSRFAADNPDKTLTIDADVLVFDTLQVYDGFKLFIIGQLANGSYIKADNSLIKADSLINYGNIDAANNGSAIFGDTENNGYLNAYDGGEIWLTGTLSGDGSFDRNVYYNGLGARYLNYNNDGPYEDTNNGLQSRIITQKARRTFVFYKMDYTGPEEGSPFGSWALTPVKAADLTLKNSRGEVVTGALKTLEEQGITYDNFTEFIPPDWDNFTVSYGDYSMSIDVELPQLGFYKQPNRYEAYWTEDSEYTPGGENCFYLIYYSDNNSADVTELLQYEGSDKVDCEPYTNPSGLNIWEVSVKNDITEDFNLELGVRLRDGDHEWEETARLWLKAGDYEHLVWLHEDRIRDGKFNENDVRAEVVAGEGWGGAFFLYCQEDENWTYMPVSEANLQVNGQPLEESTGITFEKYTGEANTSFFRLDFKTAGAYHITYHEGGNTIPFGVAFNVIDLPDFGVYSEPEGGKNNYIYNWDMQLSKYRTVYVIPAGGLSLEGLDLNSSEVGGGYEKTDLGSVVIGEDKAVTIGEYLKITAEYGGDSVCDYFKVEFLKNPLLNGNVYFRFNLRDENGDEIMRRDFNFNSNIERADDVIYNGSIETSEGTLIEGLTDRRVVYYNFTAAEDGWYSFRLSGASRNGDFGLYIFSDDWQVKGENWRYFDVNNNMLVHAEYLQAGKTYKVAVFDRTGNEAAGSIRLSIAEAAQPAAPEENVNAKLCLDPAGVYSIRLSEGGNGNTWFRIYAYINGKWQNRGDRGLWHDDKTDRWNDENCYFADMLNNGETAVKFGVTAVNGDGVESNMLELTPAHPVTRDDSAFVNPAYDLMLRHMPDNQLLLTATTEGQPIVFSPSSSYRLYHRKYGDDERLERDFDMGFGTDRARIQLSSYNDRVLTEFKDGWWEFDVSCQRFDAEVNKFIVGWDTAARKYDEGIGGDNIGSMDYKAGNTWIVRDGEDLSNVSEFRFDRDISFWYTPNSTRLWLGTFDGTSCSYTEIKPSDDITFQIEDINGSTITDMVYNEEFGRWDFDFSALNDGDFVRFVLTAGISVLASEYVTVVAPDAGYFTGPEITKEGLCDGRIFSNQDEFYFVWDESFEQNRGITGYELHVFQETAYIPDDGRTYYKRGADGSYEITSGFEENTNYFIEDNSLIYCEEHFDDNYLKFTNTYNSGKLDIVLRLKKGTKVVETRNQWIELAGYMFSSGVGRLDGWIDWAFCSPYGDQVGVLDSSGEEVMVYYNMEPGDNSFHFEGLTPGKTYYLYYYHDAVFVRIKGIEAVCQGISGVRVNGDAVTVDYTLGKSHIGEFMVVASYTDGKMTGVKMVRLAEADITAGAVQVTLPEGDTYKAFVLSGDGRYAMVAGYVITPSHSTN